MTLNFIKLMTLHFEWKGANVTKRQMDGVFRPAFFLGGVTMKMY